MQGEGGETRQTMKLLHKQSIMKPKLFEQIYEIVSQIPKGKVMTYGQIAKLVNTNPRVIGYALHGNTDPVDVPCHRVIKSDGTIAKGYAFGGPEKQIEKLRAEGVLFATENTVDLHTSLFTGKRM